MFSTCSSRFLLSRFPPKEFHSEDWQASQIFPSGSWLCSWGEIALCHFPAGLSSETIASAGWPLAHMPDFCWGLWHSFLPLSSPGVECLKLPSLLREPLVWALGHPYLILPLYQQIPPPLSSRQLILGVNGVCFISQAPCQLCLVSSLHCHHYTMGYST